MGAPRSLLRMHREEFSMPVKTRKQEVWEFFEKTGLFMPPTRAAQEGIYCYVNSTYGNGLDNFSSEERVALLKEADAKYRGRLVRKRVVFEDGFRIERDGPIFRVRYLLPKTAGEVWKQFFDRGSGALEDLGEVSHFKACVTGSAWRGPTRIIFLDMLELVKVKA